MKLIDGWLIPDLLSGPGNYLRRWHEIEPYIADVMPKRTAIQAGGHIGIWPKMLGAMFERVYCFEPDAENFRALAHNVTDGHVFPARGFLGNERGPRGLHRSQKSTGQHFVHGKGDIPTFRIDDLGLDDVDLICLDVEGFEIPALKGARCTIDACRPIIIAEENRRCQTQGFAIGELAETLGTLGYKVGGAVGEDLIFEPRQS